MFSILGDRGCGVCFGEALGETRIDAELLRLEGA